MRPAVERTLAAFGDPLAAMRDLGRAGARAVAGCRQRGSQISRSRVRSQLRDLLRKARSAQRVRADLPALLLWILEGEGYKHLPYPFLLPHRDFFRRCEQFPHQRDRRLPRPRTRAELGLLRQASQALADLQRLNSKAGGGRRPPGSQLDPIPCLAGRPAPVLGRTAARCTPGTLSSPGARGGCCPAASHHQRPAALPEEPAPAGQDSRRPRAGTQPVRADHPPLSGSLWGRALRASRGPRCRGSGRGGRGPHQQCHRAVLREGQTGPAPPSGPRSSGA